VGGAALRHLKAALRHLRHLRHLRPCGPAAQDALPSPPAPQIGPSKAVACAEAAAAGRLARFSSLSGLNISMRALDALDDAQAAGLAAGLAPLSSLAALEVEWDAGARPAGASFRLSLLLQALTTLRSLTFRSGGGQRGQPPVRSPAAAPATAAFPRCCAACRMPRAALSAPLPPPSFLVLTAASGSLRPQTG